MYMYCTCMLENAIIIIIHIYIALDPGIHENSITVAEDVHDGRCIAIYI